MISQKINIKKLTTLSILISGLFVLSLMSVSVVSAGHTTIAPAAEDTDSDGIANAIDHDSITGADLSTAFSNDFKDDGTFGTIVDRGGWNVKIDDLASPAGVRVSISGSGTTARIVSCNNNIETKLNAAGETVNITCGSTTVNAVQAFPTVEMLTAITPSVTATIAVGETPDSVAVDADSVWVANVTSNTVSRISKATNTVTATITVGARPFGVAVDTDSVWVANLGSNTVSRISKTSNTVIDTINVGSQPGSIAVDADSVWVTNHDSNTVSQISKATKTVTATIPVGTGPSGVAVDADSVWVANLFSNTVSRINKANLTDIVTITVGARPVGVAVDADSVWVANSNSGTVSRISKATKTVTATISVGARPRGVAVDADSVWVANHGSNTVSQISKATKTVTATIPIVGTGPGGVAVDADSVWVTNQSFNTVSRINKLSSRVRVTLDTIEAARMGSPITAVAGTILVEILDKSGVVIGTGTLNQGDTLDIEPNGPEGLVVISNPGTTSVTFTLTLEGQTLTLTPGQTFTDKCPGTAPGATVDQNGCSKVQIDSDSDGVCNLALTSTFCTGGPDQCPSTKGFLTHSGCPVADLTNVELHIIDQANIGLCPDGKTSCRIPVGGTFSTPSGTLFTRGSVKVFDRNNPDFQATWTKNPSGSLYPFVFNNNTGLIRQCSTNTTGSCVIGETETGDYLVIASFFAFERGAGRIRGYTGLPKSPTDFVDSNRDGAPDFATKDLSAIWMFDRFGSEKFIPASKKQITGSMLEIFYPALMDWGTSTNVTYPFIFTSDSNWTTDICLGVPLGYKIVGDSCQQTFLSGETKVILFEVVATGSPKPDVKVKLKASHGGKTQNLDIDIPGERKGTEKHNPEPLKPATLQPGDTLWSLVRSSLGNLNNDIIKEMTMKLAKYNRISIPEWGIANGTRDAKKLLVGSVIDLIPLDQYLER